jgi:chloride channel protein, CIC family
MAIIVIFEITLDYQIILPLMLACVAGYYTSVSIERRSIYAEALKRKGAGDYRKQFAELHVRDIMKPQPLTISSHSWVLGDRREIHRNPIQLPLRH